jgi:hypothetical protein
VIPDGLQIGQDLAADASRFFVTKRGVVLVTQDMLRASQGVAAAAPVGSAAPAAPAAAPASP